VLNEARDDIKGSNSSDEKIYAECAHVAERHRLADGTERERQWCGLVVLTLISLEMLVVLLVAP
jgi:hypothetical protein